MKRLALTKLGRKRFAGHLAREDDGLGLLRGTEKKKSAVLDSEEVRTSTLKRFIGTNTTCGDSDQSALAETTEQGRIAIDRLTQYLS